MAVEGEQLRSLRNGSGTIPANVPLGSLVMAVFADNYWPAQTPDGEPFVVDLAVPSIAIPLAKGRRGLRSRLMADVFELTSRVPTDTAMAQMLNMAEGLCGQAADAQPRLRCARSRDGSVVLDLGRRDGCGIVLTERGWEQTSRPPGLFRRSALIRSLPDPVHGGSSRAISRLVNVHTPDELSVYMACRLISLLPEGTRPVELITGQAGSAKTGTTRITVHWTGGEMASVPKEPRDWAAVALNAHTLGHDNVSRISAERSDLLCKAASGDTWTARELYSDGTVYLVKFLPLSIIINAIDIGGSMRGDLVRRNVTHSLIKPSSYMPEADIERIWQEGHGDALGWLLDMLVAVLQVRDQIMVPDGDTMPEFSRVLLSVDRLWGTRGYSAWKRQQEQSYTEILEDDQVAIAITGCIKEPFIGSAQELLSRMYGVLQDTRWDVWTPRRLAGAVDRCRTALEAAGWVVERPYDNHAKSKKIVLYPPSTMNGHG
jgi:hypothetical protein